MKLKTEIQLHFFPVRSGGALNQKDDFFRYKVQVCWNEPQFQTENRFDWAINIRQKKREKKSS